MLKNPDLHYHALKLLEELLTEVLPTVEKFRFWFVFFSLRFFIKPCVGFDWEPNGGVVVGDSWLPEGTSSQCSGSQIEESSILFKHLFKLMDPGK